jgi:transcriptional regulator with XRE-family HTH domain
VNNGYARGGAERSADRIRGLCRTSKLTYQQVGAGVGLDAASIERWEKGADIDPFSARRLARYYGVTVGFLLGEECWSAPPPGHVEIRDRGGSPVFNAKLKLPDGTQPRRRRGRVWAKRSQPPAGYLTRR